MGVFTFWRAPGSQVLLFCSSVPPDPNREGTGIPLITSSEKNLFHPPWATRLSSSKEPETKSGEELVRHDLETVQSSGLGLRTRGPTPSPPTMAPNTGIWLKVAPTNRENIYSGRFWGAGWGECKLKLSFYDFFLCECSNQESDGYRAQKEIKKKTPKVPRENSGPVYWDSNQLLLLILFLYFRHIQQEPIH